MFRIKTLGTFRTMKDSTDITAQLSPKARMLVAYLALCGPSSRALIKQLLWSEEINNTTLRSLLKKIRVYLPVVGETNDAPLALPSDTDIDAMVIERYIQRARTAADPEMQAAAWRAAAHLYRGAFLDGMEVDGMTEAYEEWLRAQRGRYQRLMQDAVSDLRQHGQIDVALQIAQQLVRIEPYDHTSCRHLMELFAQAGNTADALATYQAYADLLRHELHQEPDDDLAHLAREIQSRPAPLPPSGACLGTSTLTPLIGRKEELAQVVEHLRGPSQIVTITGPGGVGKTRLALEVARQLRSDPTHPFFHGINLVSLAHLSTGPHLNDALAQTIAQSLSLPLDGSELAIDQVRRALRQQARLLILDNADQVRGIGTALCGLLETVHSVRVLVTSRERLRVAGEQIVRLNGLTTSAPDDAWTLEQVQSANAVQLFLQVAHYVEPTFALTQETAPKILAICCQLDGLPLGIELAASLLHVVSLDMLADKLRDTLDVLEDAPLERPPHHTSLRAVFAASWSLLSPDAQRVLACMTVFHGAFSYPAAEAVAEVSIGTLAALRDASLLQRVNGDHYALQSVIRTYAAEYLDDHAAAAVQRRHATFSLRRLADRLADLRGPQQAEVLRDVVADLTDIETAWQYAAAHREMALLRAAAPALFSIYDVRSWFMRGERLFDQAAHAMTCADDESCRTRAILIGYRGWYLSLLGHHGSATAFLEESIETLRAVGTAEDLLFPLNYLGAVHLHLAHLSQAVALCEEALTIAQHTGDVHAQAVAWNILGQIALKRPDYHTARRCADHSIQIDEQRRNDWSLCYGLSTRAKVAAQWQEDTAQERSLLERVLTIREELGDQRGTAHALTRLGQNARREKRWDDAQTLLRQALGIYQHIDHTRGVIEVRLEQTALALDQKQFGECQSILRDITPIIVRLAELPLMHEFLKTVERLLRLRDEVAAANDIAIVNNANIADMDALGDYIYRVSLISL